MGRIAARIEALALALGAPGLFIVTFLDSSLLSLPEIADLLVVWMVMRWLKNRKPKTKGSSAEPVLDDVNRWYGDARERLLLLEKEEVKRREGLWDALSREEKLQQSISFLRDRFGPRVDGKFTAEEQLTLGRVYYLTKV